MDLSGITAIGVDEIAVGKGHHYLAVVDQIDFCCRRLLWIGNEGKEATLEEFFAWFGKARTDALRFVCSDMWKPCLNMICISAHQSKFYSLNAMGAGDGSCHDVDGDFAWGLPEM